MSGKQMEGDNQRRRTLARQARQRGDQPSSAGVTLGASKQFTHLEEKHRDGPLSAGSHRKPTPGSNPPGATAPPPEPNWPLPDPVPPPGAADGVAVLQYRELVADVGRRTGVNFAEARAAAEATVTALARALDETARERLFDAVPAELRDDDAVAGVDRRQDLQGFLEVVARLSRRTPEQARYQAQATLGAMVDQDRELMDSLDLPTDLRELLGPLPAGADQVDPTGGTARLTDEELASAMRGLPYWSTDGRALTRAIELPRENLDRVLGLLALLKPELGRGPSIGRPSAGTALLTVRTKRVGAVTALDVELAHRVDAAIEEAGAGMS